MVEESGFRAVVGFLGKLGVYDVVLPFLLVFTIVFAILEKTRILGTEKIGDKETTKKNLNSMVALSMAFLVIASTKLVAVISEVMADIVLLLILSISFLLLVGSFFGSKQFTLEEFPGWIKFFMVLMFIGIIVIFLNALDWLKFVLGLFENWDADWAVSVIFLIVILAFMWYMVREPSASATTSKKS